MDRRVRRRIAAGDVMTPTQRRKAMQSNRGRTRLERRVGLAIWRAGLRYLSSDGYRARAGHQFPGKPDLILVGRRCVVFVDGCFWHGCEHCHDFDHDLNASWRAKIARNVNRDQQIRRHLRRMGWKVLVVKEHDLTTEERFCRAIHRLMSLVPPIR